MKRRKPKSKPRKRFDGPIHERIATLRNKLGLTQEKLGEIVGVDSTLLSHWETGFARPPIACLTPLADALGISVDDLIDGEERAA